MDISLLGPIVVRENGSSIVPSAKKPRQLLALLAFRAGQIVPIPTIIDELWGEEVPTSAATTVQTYILQIRRLIAKAVSTSGAQSAKQILVTTIGGYRLEGRLESYDLRDHARLIRQGTLALGQGDALAASDALGSALTMARGPVLVDVPVGRVLELEVLGLTEERMRALELRIEADLMLGRHAGLVPELRKLAAQHPLNERLAAQLILALYRSGQSWRALDVFRQLRSTLVSELGIEPSPRLQRLHRAVLDCDPYLDGRGVIGL